MTASILHNNQDCKELGPIKWNDFIMFIITYMYLSNWKKNGIYRTWYIIFFTKWIENLRLFLKKGMPFSLPSSSLLVKYSTRYSETLVETNWKHKNTIMKGFSYKYIRMVLLKNWFGLNIPEKLLTKKSLYSI